MQKCQACSVIPLYRLILNTVQTLKITQITQPHEIQKSVHTCRFIAEWLCYLMMNTVSCGYLAAGPHG